MAEAKQTSSSMGWVVVLAGLGINLCLGVLYTWSLFTSALTNKWAWSAADALTPYAIALGMFALTMVFAGRLQDKIGPRIAATIGGCLVGLGMVVASFAPKPPAALVAKFVELKPAADAAIAKGLPAAAEFAAAKAALAPFVGPALPWLAVGFGILTGAGIGFAYAAATPAAVKWFAPTKKGLISGIVVAGFGLASVYTAPLTGSMLANTAFGVSGTFLWLGVAFFIAILIFAQLLRNPPEGYVPAADTNVPTGASAPKAAHRDYTWQEMIKTPQFWMMWVMYAFAAGAGLMVVGIVAKYALGIADISAQMTAITNGFKGGSLDWVSKAGATFTIVMALAIGNGVGRPITGMISDRIGRTRTMMAVFIFQAVLLVVLGFVNTFAVLLVVAGFIGFNYGANLTLFPAMTFDFFGTKNGGVNYGLMFTAWGLGGVLGSIGAGFAKDYFGSFQTAFYVAAGLLVVATVLAAVIRSPKAVTATSPSQVAAASE
jgi:OFA family oxalate/formate antiporter-like MFS transporter